MTSSSQQLTNVMFHSIFFSPLTQKSLCTNGMKLHAYVFSLQKRKENILYVYIQCMVLSCVGYINFFYSICFFLMLALPFNSDLCVMKLLANSALGIFPLHNIYTDSCINAQDLCAKGYLLEKGKETISQNTLQDILK